ncbi:fused MFS/spermidine synthase [Ruania alkalisoli]|uniref:Fused MFS/spermidine synthase n=1 Tax=Ruania alkalisoli TaxID=2779775 RepID=A0A7M1SW51_9MICO|nr:fused MFS/spermidine synthase [Ruania alkalisoli]QOR71287.1 fused MFS/spermidine synthase [Ruania alkalisoli]
MSPSGETPADQPATAYGPDGGQDAAEQVTFSDGSRAELIRDGEGWTLRIDGIRQAHVGPVHQPPELTSVRWMLAALGDALPARSAHLGGSLLTLPRAIAARRPDAEQVVVELEPALVTLVESRFPPPPGVRIEVGDARSWLEAPTAGDLDAVVLDIFAANRIPPAFTSLECFAAAQKTLRPAGVLVINSVAGPQLEFTRREIATLRELFDHVGMIIQGSVLHGARFGNATLIASDAPLDVAGIQANLAGDSSKGVLLTDLGEIVGDAAAMTDADAMWSPAPNLPDYEGALTAIDAMRAMVRELKPPR